MHRLLYAAHLRGCAQAGNTIEKNCLMGHARQHACGHQKALKDLPFLTFPTSCSHWNPQPSYTSKSLGSIQAALECARPFITNHPPPSPLHWPLVRVMHACHAMTKHWVTCSLTNWHQLQNVLYQVLHSDARDAASPILLLLQLSGRREMKCL